MGYLLCVKFSVVGFKERRKEEREEEERKEEVKENLFVCLGVLLILLKNFI